MKKTPPPERKDAQILRPAWHIFAFTCIIFIFPILLSTTAFAQTPDVNYQWAKRIGDTTGGNTYADYGMDITADSTGNVYITGYFQGTADFDPGAGILNLTSAGLEDIFISKFDGGGNLVWAKSIGAGGGDEGHSIIVDVFGNVYTTGSFKGTVDFDPGLGIFNLGASGNDDIFISKLDTSGNFVWAKAISGANYEKGYSIAVDGNGNCYIAGSFQGIVDFDPGADTANLTSIGGIADIFFAKYDQNGNYLWANSIGSAGDDEAYSIAVDGSGNTYITGFFEGTADFDPGVGVANLTPLGSRDIFFAKYDQNGNYLWAKNIEITIYGDGRSITVDGSGNTYITGYFNGTADFDPGAGTSNITTAGVRDIFFAKYDQNGNYLWAKSIGSPDNDYGFSIAVDAIGNVYITGYFTDTADFDPDSNSIYNLSSLGSEDIFLAKYDNNGNYLWAYSIGSSNGNVGDFGNSIAADISGNVYITGYFAGINADFDPGSGTANLTSAGSYDIFFAKYSQPVCDGIIYTDTIALILHDGINCIDYPIVKIGSQWWMRENVNATLYSDSTALVDGTGAGNITGNDTTKYYFNYDDNPANSVDYGKLYTWAAAMNGAESSDSIPSNVQGVCPTGWHLPGDSEWKQLELYIGMSQAEVDATQWRGNKGHQLKEIGPSHWGGNCGTDSLGFTAIPDGYRWPIGGYSYLTTYGYLWTATEEVSGTNAWLRNLACNQVGVARIDNWSTKEHGVSVRCVMDPVIQQPLTASITNVSSVTCNGASDGSATVTATGGTTPYTYSWNTVPVQTDSVATGLAAGTYIVTVTDAASDTVINSVTITEPPYVATYTDTITLILHDGINCIDYPIVKIGSQWWMAENVNATLYSDSTPVTYYNYNNDIAMGIVYGKLYEWADAMNGAASSDSIPSGVQGVCPTGWHLPSDAEWKQLEMNLGMNQASADSTGWRGTDEGGQLKDTGTTYWASPNTGATNSSGFTALPGGDRSTGGSFLNVGDYGFWWSATEGSGTDAWDRALYYTEARADRSANSKAFGFSCRCVKDIDLFDNLIISISNVTNVSCNGGSDGSASLTVLSGVSPYTYSWSTIPAQTDSVATGLAAGTYTVTVTDAGSDTAIDSVTITEPPYVATFTDTISIPPILHDGINCIDYPIVKIGSQWWMQENVNAALYADNTPISYYNYNNDTAIAAVYGKLYEWADAMKGAASSDSIPSGVQGVCPSGWHLPSDAEWKQLERELGMSMGQADNIGWRGTTEGGKLKEADTTHWASPNSGATNSSGFTALPGGERDWSGPFFYVGYTGYWWSATENSGTYAWWRMLDYGNMAVYRDPTNKANAFSIRCVRDVTPPCITSSSFTPTATSVCQGDTITFTNTSAGATTYEWQENGTTFSTDTNTLRAFNIAGTYTISLIADSASCSDSSGIVITINPTYSISDPAVAICTGDSALIYGIYRITAGTYYDNLTTINGCDSIHSTTLNVDGPSITSSVTNISCPGESDGSATVTAAGGIPPYSYLWNDPTATATATATGLSAGSYTIIVSDNSGCSSSDTIIVDVSGGSNCLNIPNVFTPNGDGDNDVWRIRGVESFPDITVKVFNEWGGLIYESKGYSVPWDGTHRGKALPVATYYYVIEFNDENNGNVTGPVAIIR